MIKHKYEKKNLDYWKRVVAEEAVAKEVVQAIILTQKAYAGVAVVRNTILSVVTEKLGVQTIY